MKQAVVHPTSFIPFEPSPTFIGRALELKAMAAALIPAQAALVLVGPSGIGKTSLVTAFITHYSYSFPGGIVWINCANSNSIELQLAGSAQELSIDRTGLDGDQLIEQVIKVWQLPIPRLLIFDNCADPRLLAQWQPLIGGCRVLVTSRSDQWSTLSTLQLAMLVPNESRELLQQACPRLSAVEATTLAAHLGHFPLTLHVAASYLQVISSHNVQRYQHGLSLLKQQESVVASQPLDCCIASVRLTINQLDSLALGMLDYVAWCAHGVPLPRAFVLTFIAAETPVDTAVATLQRLLDVGLLSGTNAIIIHQVVGEIVHAQVGDQANAFHVVDQWQTQLNALDGSAYFAAMRWAAPHLQQLASRMQGWGDRAVAICANQLAAYADDLNWDSLAEHWYRQAIQAEERSLGVLHEQLATSFNNLAESCIRQGKTLAAIDYAQRAYQINCQLFGEIHETTMFHSLRVGQMLSTHGSYHSAQAWYRQTLAILAQLDPAEHISTILEANLALIGLLQSDGQTEDAHHIYQQAMHMLHPFPITKDMDAYWDQFQALQATHPNQTDQRMDS
ncbi:tetratricopeptide repeat protein [Herpetosiphon llansteffanensis]|uniref:tetratricopeptide repeat protein n=1 Tax=Herpetosiphon llansteffanensis TaxID=2094568 RepID=UPI0013DF4499|nr:tetratricopeptide repeat protein [Herpetosiphon llansteffanensis]